MILNIDIFRSANVMVTRHGQDSPIHADMRADAMLDKGESNATGQERGLDGD